MSCKKCGQNKENTVQKDVQKNIKKSIKETIKDIRETRTKPPCKFCD